MKMVWDNYRPTVTANGLKSRGTLESVAPDTQRKHMERLYPVLRMGALEMQRQAQVALEQHKQRKCNEFIDWLNNL
jgi:hypothetical protein